MASFFRTRRILYVVVSTIGLFSNSYAVIRVWDSLRVHFGAV